MERALTKKNVLKVWLTPCTFFLLQVNILSSPFGEN